VASVCGYGYTGTARAGSGVEVRRRRRAPDPVRRHLDSEIIDFTILSEDYSKLAFLCADRSICFHAKFGKYHRQGLTLVHFSAQPEPFLTPNTP
jgi:hypothetical protein